MALTLDFSVRLLDILTANNFPGFVLAKLRNLRVVEISDFVGLAAREQDSGEFPELLKPQDGTPEDALTTKMSIRKAWRQCRDAQNADKAPPAKKSAPDSDCDTDSDDEVDLIVRRAMLDNWRSV